VTKRAMQTCSEMVFMTAGCSPLSTRRATPSTCDLPGKNAYFAGWCWLSLAVRTTARLFEQGSPHANVRGSSSRPWQRPLIRPLRLTESGAREPGDLLSRSQASPGNDARSPSLESGARAAQDQCRTVAPNTTPRPPSATALHVACNVQPDATKPLSYE
jgi:hypothetical protein